MTCCAIMAYHVADQCRGSHPHEYGMCGDQVVRTVDEGYGVIYALPVHDGGSSFIVIEFCPWCGTRLSTPAGPTAR